MRPVLAAVLLGPAFVEPELKVSDFHDDEEDPTLTFSEMGDKRHLFGGCDVTKRLFQDVRLRHYQGISPTTCALFVSPGTCRQYSSAARRQLCAGMSSASTTPSLSFSIAESRTGPQILEFVAVA